MHGIDQTLKSNDRHITDYVYYDYFTDNYPCNKWPVIYYVSDEPSMEASQLPSRKYEIMWKLGAKMALNLPPWLPNYDVKWLNMNFTCAEVMLECKSQSITFFNAMKQSKQYFCFQLKWRHRGICHVGRKCAQWILTQYIIQEYKCFVWNM